MTLIIHIIIFLASIGVIWFFAGLIIDSVDRIAKRFQKNSFIVAFFILGFLTSLGEMSVAVNSILSGAPQVSAGNLVGASFVLLLLVVPLLAVIGNGIKMNKVFDGWKLWLVLGVIVLPAVFFLDGSISKTEGVASFMLYILLIWGMRNRTPDADVQKIESQSIPVGRASSLFDFGKVIVGAGVVFLAGYLLVQEAVYFAELLNAPKSLIGILLLSIGTNIPELAIAVRAVLKKQADVALGNYLGSAAMNTLIFAFLAVVSGPFDLNISKFWISFVFVVIGFSLFYLFIRSKDVLSRIEGLALLCVYALFIGVQLYTLVQFATQ